MKIKYIIVFINADLVTGSDESTPPILYCSPNYYPPVGDWEEIHLTTTDRHELVLDGPQIDLRLKKTHVQKSSLHSVVVYCYVCVLLFLYMCPPTTMYVRILLICLYVKVSCEDSVTQ